MRTLYAVLVVAVVAGCVSVTPVKLQSGDTCYRCHRTINDTKLAAEMLDRSDAIATSYPFRTAGCMAKYLKANAPSKFTTIYVTDYRTGRMIQARSAWFVATELISPDGKTVEQDYVAFGSRDTANKFRQDLPVLRLQDQPLRQWDQVLAEVVPD